MTPASRWPRLGIRTQLFGLMMLLVLTGGGVLVLDESSQTQSERALRGLVEGPLASLRRIKAMSDAYSHDLLATAYKARDGQIGLTQAQRLGEDALRRIDGHWQALVGQARGPEQQSLMVQIAQARVDADRASRELLTALRNGDREAILQLCQGTLAPAIDPVILRLRFLSDLEIIGAENVLREEQARGERNSVLRVGLSLFTLAVVLLVGVRLARNLVRGIEGLDLMARRLLERDFREQPVHRPSGELGEVVDAFNAMRAELLRYGSELRASELRANAANRAKSAFLATMSHELRTPMIGVTGMVEVMAHTRLDEDQRRALAMIRHSADNLLQIIGDILDFSKIEAGKLDLAPAALDLRRLVEAVVLNFVAAASSKGLSLDCRIDPRLAPAYRADALRLRQILGNFLSNAIKFTEHGGVHVSVELLLQHDASDRLALAVSDTGIGIAQELQGQLFDPFTQAESSTTRRFGGSGLGLAICARLAELMGAEISLNSREGEGTTLRLELELNHASPSEPAAEAEADPTQPLQHRVLPTPEDAEAERSLVLLVDDHPTNRLVVTRQLALAGFRCEACNDGTQGLAAWRSGRFALVLTDLHMPLMDGYQLATEIRAEEARRDAHRTPIIALTAAVLKGEAERCLEAGMDDYLTKPASIATLVQRLHHWLPHLQLAPAARPRAGPWAEGVDPAERADAAIAAQRAEQGCESTPAALPSYDPEVLVSILGPAPDQLRLVLDDFITAARADLAAAQLAATCADTSAVAREAHKLKGASALAGASALQAQAGRIEAEAKAMTAMELDHALAVLALRLAEFEAATERIRLAASAP